MSVKNSQMKSFIISQFISSIFVDGNLRDWSKFKTNINKHIKDYVNIHTKEVIFGYKSVER